MFIIKRVLQLQAGRFNFRNSEVFNTLGIIGNKKGPHFAYGDGSKNLVSNGYDPIYSKNGALPKPGYNSGNCPVGYALRTILDGKPSRTMATAITHPKGERALVKAGANEYTFTTPNGLVPSGKFCSIEFHAGSFTTGVNVSALNLKFNGVYYTLQQAFEDGLIEPMVLLNSYQSAGTSYLWNNWLNLYSGGSSSTSNYPMGYVSFVTKAPLTGYKFTANRNWDTSYADGTSLVFVDPIDGLFLEPLAS